MYLTQPVTFLFTTLKFNWLTKANAGLISVNFVSRTTGVVASPDLLRVEFGSSSTGIARVKGNDVWNDVEKWNGNVNLLGDLGENRFSTKSRKAV